MAKAHGTTKRVILTSKASLNHGRSLFSLSGSLNKMESQEFSQVDGMILEAWKTNNQVTVFLVEHLSPELWGAKVPGAPRRTVRMLAGHIHNARCMWIKTLGMEHGIEVPQSVNRYRLEPEDLIAALHKSSVGLLSLLQLGLDHSGVLPDSARYLWRNLPLDVGHVLAYFIAHEGHHRGQIVMIARQLGHRLPQSVTAGLWQWSTLSQPPEQKRSGHNRLSR